MILVQLVWYSRKESNMFLRNYYNLVARWNLNLGKSVSSGTFGNGSLLIKNNGGGYIDYLNDVNAQYYCVNLTSLKIVFSSTVQGIVFGTGNEPVTFDDYVMGTLITSGLNTTFVSISDITYDGKSNKFNCTSRHTLSNTSDSEIVIREYGIQLREGYSGFLIFRDLLEPYSLQPSESVNVILNASYTMPTIDESGNVVAGTQAYGLAIE